MKELSIDLETYSDIDIQKCGTYKYTESDNFVILLFGVSVDGSPVKVYDLACGDTVPEEILAALSDDNVTKWAFNAAFERICLSNWLKSSCGCYKIHIYVANLLQPFLKFYIKWQNNKFYFLISKHISVKIF